MYLCLTRRWKTDGLKGKYNSPVPEEEYNRNKVICDTLRGIECASNPKCLWAKENEQFELEGPTIKLIKNIKTQVMTKDELDKNLKTRSEFVSSEAIQKIQKMITIDEQNIAYEIESTDFDDNLSFNGRLREFIRSLKKNKNKPQPHHQSQTPHHIKPQTHHHKAQTPHHEITNRRRLPQLDANGRAGQNYRSVGVIATIHPANHGVEALQNQIYTAATGSIIYVTNSNPKYIYVLVAAHDMIKYVPEVRIPLYGLPDSVTPERVEMTGPLQDYKFIPQFAGNDNELKEFNTAGRTVGRLQRVWIPKSFDSPTISLDIAILRFEVPQAFNVLPLQLEHNGNVPAVNDRRDVPNNYQNNAYNKDFIYYEITNNWNSFQMHHKDVNIYCFAALCMYRNTQIKKGYCGGPIIHNNHIMAMQASRARLPEYDAIQDEQDPRLFDDCDEINPNNCIGYAMNMQENLIKTIRLIYKMDAMYGGLAPDVIARMRHWETQAGYIVDRNNVYQERATRDSDSDSDSEDDSKEDARQEMRNVMNSNMYTYPMPYGYYNPINPNNQQYLSNGQLLNNNNGNYVTIEWLAIFLPTLLINLCLFAIICLAFIGFSGIFCYHQVKRANRDHHANSSYHPLQRKDGCQIDQRLSDEDV